MINEKKVMLTTLLKISTKMKDHQENSLYKITGLEEHLKFWLSHLPKDLYDPEDRKKIEEIMIPIFEFAYQTGFFNGSESIFHKFMDVIDEVSRDSV